jgi:hypothetical protein
VEYTHFPNAFLCDFTDVRGLNAHLLQILGQCCRAHYVAGIQELFPFVLCQIFTTTKHVSNVTYLYRFVMILFCLHTTEHKVIKSIIHKFQSNFSVVVDSVDKATDMLLGRCLIRISYGMLTLLPDVLPKYSPVLRGECCVTTSN